MLKRLQLDSRVNRTERRVVRGRRFQVPVLGGLAASISEPWMMDLLAALLPRRAGAFLDVGVNLGQTLLKLRAVDAERPYLGFEPNPACVAYLERLVAANSLGDVTILPVGVGAAPGLMRLQLFGDATDSSASIVPDFRSAETVTGTKFVPILSFAELRSLLPDQVAIIKIDVEGAELEVLTTLAPHVADTRPFVLIEVLPAYTAENRRRVERQYAIEAILASLDYQIYRVLRRPGGVLDSVEAVSSFGIHSNLDWSDYVLAPSEHSRMVAEAFPSGQR